MTLDLFSEFIPHTFSIECTVGLILLFACLLCLLKFKVNQLNLLEIALIQGYLHFQLLLGKAKGFTSTIFTIFIMISTINIIGLLPEIYPITSNPLVVLTLASILFIVTVLNGLLFHTKQFLAHFFIPGLPMITYFLLTPIEIIAYCLRPIILSARLSIAISAGHIVTQVFGHIASLVLPGIAFVIAICIFEILVSILQAYLFAMLSALYIEEQYH